MAANTSPIFEAVVVNKGIQIVAADTTTKKSLHTGGTNGTRIDSISCTSNDTSAVALAFYITIGGTDYYIGDVNLAIGAGYTTVSKVDALATLAPSLGYLPLGSGDVLKVAAVATVTAAKTVDVVATGGDY